MATGVELQLAAGGVRSVMRRTGRAERDEHAEPVSSSEIELRCLPASRRRKCALRSTVCSKACRESPPVSDADRAPIVPRSFGTPVAIAIVVRVTISRYFVASPQIEGELKALPGTRDGRRTAK